MAAAAVDRIRSVIPVRPVSTWCLCAEPLLDLDDDDAFCWRCRRPIEAVDRDGLGLDIPEGDDE